MMKMMIVVVMVMTTMLVMMMMMMMMMMTTMMTMHADDDDGSRSALLPVRMFALGRSAVSLPAYEAVGVAQFQLSVVVTCQ